MERNGPASALEVLNVVGTVFENHIVDPGRRFADICARDQATMGKMDLVGDVNLRDMDAVLGRSAELQSALKVGFGIRLEEGVVRKLLNVTFGGQSNITLSDIARTCKGLVNEALRARDPGSVT